MLRRCERSGASCQRGKAPTGARRHPLRRAWRTFKMRLPGGMAGVASATLLLDQDGAERLPHAALALLPDIEAALDSHALAAGVRIRRNPALAALFASDSSIGRTIARRTGETAAPVRAILFDKRADRNWALGWHQDRTIAVAKRVEVAGFGPWSIKQGIQHVAPPITLLARMHTIRVHLDPVPVNNAPLLIAPGSHRLGRVAEPDIAAAVAQCGSAACLAECGDIWIYATSILHASDRAADPRRRRVLQIDYSPDSLPGGLEWMGL